jgi:pimeloyl-ACP methyl ester carboxylesterase
MRKKLTTSNGATVSYSTCGSGPPLVLVHGAFSDDVTNWEFVAPMLEMQFTIYAMARRGRGETDATSGHRPEDEARDVAALIEAIGEPVFLLGHSYGGHCVLLVANLAPDLVRKLVVYEPVWPSLISAEALKPLERLAASGEWRLEGAKQLRVRSGTFSTRELSSVVTDRLPEPARSLRDGCPGGFSIECED